MPFATNGIAPPGYSFQLKPCSGLRKYNAVNRKPISSVTVNDLVMTPNHIHAMIFLYEKAEGASPRPTV